MNINIYKNELTVSDTMVSGYKYIHVIQLNGITGPGTQYVKYTHESSTTTLATDGYYTVTQMKLPLTQTPGTYYIIEGTVDQVIGPDEIPISIKDLLLVNPVGTTIVRQDQDIFMIYLLKTYYTNLIRSKFLKNICNCDCISKQDRLMIDTLTMGLALIEELNVYSQYYESQRLVELLWRCSGTVITNCNCNG